MFAWIKGLFGSGDAVKKTFDGVGDLAKTVKTLVTGKLDPETIMKIEKEFAELDNKLAEHQSKVIATEAAGNMLQRSWRPVTMLAFLALVFLNQFGLLTIPLSGEIWGLFKVGLGGYVGGRSLEKIAGALK